MKKLKDFLEKKVEQLKSKDIKNNKLLKGLKTVDSNKKSKIVKIVSAILAFAIIYGLATVWDNSSKRSKLNNKPEVTKQDITVKVDKTLEPDTWLEESAKKVITNEKKIRDLQKNMVAGFKEIAIQNKKMFSEILNQINDLKQREIVTIQTVAKQEKKKKKKKTESEEEKEFNIEKQVKQLYQMPSVIKEIAPKPVQAPAVSPEKQRRYGNQAYRQQGKAVNTNLIFSYYKPTKSLEDMQKQQSHLRKNKLKKGYIIPLGSFVRATLLSGVFAPTGLKAKSQPLPVSLVINDRSFLPNKYRVNIKGCMAIGNAYGDLSSSRVYIKVNRLSCITKDGKVIVANTKAYVTDLKDGSIGISGKVVSRKGIFLAKSIVSIFVQGVASAFKTSLSQTTITPLGGAIETGVSASKAVKIAVGSGTAETLNNLANTYKEMLKETFPVVMVPANTQVDISFLRNVELKPIYQLEK